MSVYMRFGPLWAGEINNSTNATNTTKCPNGIQWMLKYFGECVTTPREEASEYLGLASMVIWMMVGIPQIIKNFRNLDGLAGVSFFLLFQWAGGDVTNLVGSILTRQLKFQIYLAIYFVFSDAVLLLQYIAFIVRWRRRHPKQTSTRQADGKSSTPTRALLCLMGVFLCSQVLFPSSSQSADLNPRPSGHFARSLLSIREAQSFPSKSGPLRFKSEVDNGVSASEIGADSRDWLQSRFGDEAGGSTMDTPEIGADSRDWLQSRFGDEAGGSTMDYTTPESPAKASPIFWHDETDLIGYVIGIISSLFYLGSRLSQIIKNVKKGSTEGLAFMTFFLAVLGNLAYGLQILVHSLETEFLLEKTPWLVGSLGVIGFDCTLICQFYYYDGKKCNRSEARQALLNNEITVNGQATSINASAMNSTLDVDVGGEREQDGSQRAYIY